MPRNSLLIAGSTLVILCIFMISCSKKDQVDTGTGIFLGFSTDTVFFDTVFPTVGSVTNRLIVYNTVKNKVRIEKIYLAGGQSSSYRININGIPELSAEDIELSGGDSLFIFVKVTIDPHNQSQPYVVDDSIGFLINGNKQWVKLVAWGREASFYRQSVLQGEVTWDSTRARVIYHSLRIDTGASLMILPGTRVYFHKDAYLAASSQSTLKVFGNLEHPVRFQGDRLDPFYKDLPGQWAGIFLEPGSTAHSFNHAIIKNGTYGIVVDSVGAGQSPTLSIDNTIIQNMVSSGLLAFRTYIVSVNCVIGDCGGPSLDINNGGSYDFRQLTIGNYWSSSVRNIPALYLSNYTYDEAGGKTGNALTDANFANVIVYGSNTEEIMYDSLPGTPFSVTFDHAILKTRLPVSDPQRYIMCQVNKDPVFMDVQKMNLRIDSVSPAIGAGQPLGIPYDIRGIERGSAPALGAYEYVKDPR